MPKSWDITDDTELESAVRTETQYDDTTLTQSDLSGLIESAKRVLAVKAGVTSFYSDRGITLALLGVTCAKAKGAVENSPVVVKNIAGQDVTFRTSDGSSLQLGQYEAMTREGLSASDSTDAGPRKIRFTNDYLNDHASE